MSSIFVQISAYHDHELYKTIIDCMAKSSGKNKINFGQFDFSEQKSPCLQS
jgi:hypothetical protein